MNETPFIDIFRPTLIIDRKSIGAEVEGFILGLHRYLKINGLLDTTANSNTLPTVRCAVGSF